MTIKVVDIGFSRVGKIPPFVLRRVAAGVWGYVTVGEFGFLHGQVVQCRDSSIESCRSSEKVDKLLKCSGGGDTRAENEDGIQSKQKEE